MVRPSFVPIVILCAVITGSAAEAEPLLLSAFPSGEVVQKDDLPAVMCQDWVEARTTEATRIQFWDIELLVDGSSRLLLGASSSSIYALTLSGSCRAGKHKAPAGEIMVWSHYGEGKGAPLGYSFSAQHLLEVFASKGFPADPDLVTVAAFQKKKRFWGLLRPTGFNVASPAPAALENLRESYETHPDIIAIKRASRDKMEYARNTVARFVEALGRSDAHRAAVLLSPSLFLDGSATDLTHHLLTDERVAFARHLIQSGDYQPFASAEVVEFGGALYTVSAGGRLFLITLEPFDDGLFVSSLQPKGPTPQLNLP